MECYDAARREDQQSIHTLDHSLPPAGIFLRRAHMKSIRLEDGTDVFCLAGPETRALDTHIEGYFRHVTVGADDVVFDVGANIGLFGVRLAQRTEGHARVFAFEPVTPIREVLEANLNRHGGGNQRAMACGLSRERGELDIVYYPHSPALSTTRPEVWDACGERLTDTVLGGACERSRLGGLLPRFIARRIARYLVSDAEPIHCRLSTVSDVCRELDVSRIDLLKIDVEGAELDVLLGVEPSTWPNVRQVIAEVHDLDGRVQTVCELLGQRGFDKVVVESEPGFERTVLRNVYATRAARVS